VTDLVKVSLAAKALYLDLVGQRIAENEVDVRRKIDALQDV
jgi:hypothetical protein